MKRTSLVLACLALALTTRAATPAPEKLLAADTLGLITVPDWSKARANFAASPQGQLWADPVMKPFRDKFVAKFTSDLLGPIEKELGVKLADYSDLLQGQVTFALTQNGWEGKPDQKPGFLLIIDTREKSAQLTTNLTTLRKQWVDGGKQVKSTKIRDLEFSTLVFSSDDISKSLEKIFPDPNAGTESLEDPKPKKKAEKIEWIIGQSGPLLIVGSSARDIEKAMILQSGGPVPPLAEQAGFAASAATVRDSLTFGWFNVKAIVDVVVKEAGQGNAGRPPNRNAPPTTDKIMAALGLTGLQNLSFNARDTGDGSLANFSLNIPEAQRKGLFKILAADAKDSSPPPFIPAGAVKFNRWRLDLQKGWASLEAMLIDMSPQMGSVLKLLLDNAGKDKDPNFDLRKSFIGNLGDDLITYEKSPRANTIADLGAPPSLVLLGSRNAEQLAAALKAVSGLMPPQMSKYKEREFLGRKIYSFNMPQQGAPDAKAVERTLNYAASGGYVVFSSDNAMLEEYLRSTEATGKSLRDLPGLNDAAQKVGGMGTGFFGMENQGETMRSIIETLQKDSGSVAAFLGASPLGGRLGIADDSKTFKDWFDFSLLPSYDKISKYFYLNVFSGNVTADGLSFKVFTPVPPQLKK